MQGSLSKEQETNRRRTIAISGGSIILVLLVALAGSLVTGTRVSAVTGGVESLVTISNSLLGGLADVLPLGFAFGVGMVAAVNPCGFAMLPAYLGLYLGTNDEMDANSAGAPPAQAVLVSTFVTAGFVVLFGIVGLLIGAGAQVLVTIFPWIGLAVGIILVIVGGWMLGGGALYASLGERLAAQVGSPGETSLKGYFLFGLSYGIASLSCTLPIFLSVVGSTVAVGGFIGALLQFILYALGMGFVILLLTISMALFKGAMVTTLRKGLPYVQTTSAILLMVAGGYIVYYWLTLGGLLAQIA